MNNPINDLEKFFNDFNLPEEIQLNECATIFDLPKFITSHISFLKHQSGKKSYLPYYNRLVSLKNILEKSL